MIYILHVGSQRMLNRLFWWWQSSLLYRQWRREL